MPAVLKKKEKLKEKITENLFFLFFWESWCLMKLESPPPCRGLLGSIQMALSKQKWKQFKV